MTLSTIATGGWPDSTYGGHPGPFKDSNGNIYVICAQIGGGNDGSISMFKDSGSGFAAVDNSNQPTGTVAKLVWAGIQVGDTIHIVSHSDFPGGKTQNVTVQYHTFTMSDHGSTPDEWVITDESVVTVDVGDASDVSEVACIDIAVRSDGDVIVFHPGTANSDMGTDYFQLSYSRRESASWTTDIALSTVSQQQSYPKAVIAPNDECHFVYATGEVYSRTLDSGNSLSTGAQVSSGATNDACARPVTFDPDGTQRIVFLMAGPGAIRARRMQENGSGDISQESGEADTEIDDALAGHPHNMGLAWDSTNGDVYAFFRDADQDLVYDVSADGSDSNWTTDVELEDAVSTFDVWTKFYSDNDTIGYVIDDGGVLKYGELSLSSGNQYTEDLSTSIVASTTLDDQANYAEDLATTIAATTTAADAYASSETLSTSIVATTTPNNVLGVDGAPDFADSSTVSYDSNVTQVDVPIPSGALENQIALVLVIHASGSDPTFASSDMTQIGSTVFNGGAAASLWRRTVTAADESAAGSGTWAITCTTANRQAAVCVLYGGQDVGDPLDDTDAVDAGASGVFLSVATSQAADTIIALMGSDSSGGPPDHLFYNAEHVMAERESNIYTSTFLVLYVADEQSNTAETINREFQKIGTDTNNAIGFLVGLNASSAINYQETLSTSIVATTTLDDQLNGIETLASSIVATTTETESQAMAETLSTPIVATTTSADTIAAAETLSTAVVATSTLDDLASFAETLSTAIVATTTSVDAFHGSYMETLATSIVATVTLDDPMHMAEGDWNTRLVDDFNRANTTEDGADAFGTRWTFNDSWRINSNRAYYNRGFFSQGDGFVNTILMPSGEAWEIIAEVFPLTPGSTPTGGQYGLTEFHFAQPFSPGPVRDIWIDALEDPSNTPMRIRGYYNEAGGAGINQVFDIAYNATNHAWWRLVLYPNDDVEWLTGPSADGPWTQQHYESAPMSWTQQPYVYLYADAVGFDSDAAQFDNLLLRQYVGFRKTTSIVATTTVVDQKIYAEALSTSIVATTTRSDVLSAVETLQAAIVATTTETDTQAAAEALSTSIVATTTETDNAAYAETLATSVVATTTMVDQLNGAETLATSVIATTTTTDTAAYVETLQTSIVCTTVSNDQMAGAFHENLSTSIVATTALSDALSATETLSTAIVASTTVVDAKGYTEALSTSIVATTVANDVYTPGVPGGGAFFETLATVIIATSTATDQAAFAHALVTAIVATMVLHDRKNRPTSSGHIAAASSGATDTLSTVGFPPSDLRKSVDNPPSVTPVTGPSKVRS